MRALAVVISCIYLMGCASAPPHDTSLPVAENQYPAAFNAARETLLSRRFELERVDARAGVITTKPKSTSGLATPWDTEQSSLDDEFEDLLNRQQRLVRITFEPAGEAAAGAQPPDDLRAFGGEVTARVEVVIERLRRPGWQLEPGAVRHSAYTQDPSLASRGMWPTYAVPFSQDPALAARLAEEIEQRLSLPPATAAK
jgi:hypothetical protein